MFQPAYSVDRTPQLGEPLGRHVGRVTGCEVGEDRLTWSIEVMFPAGRACGAYRWVTSRTWQPPTGSLSGLNKLGELLACFGVTTPRDVAATEPKQFFGKELVVEPGWKRNPETGDLERVIVHLAMLVESRWGHYFASKAGQAKAAKPEKVLK